MITLNELTRRADALQPPERAGRVLTIAEMTDSELTRIVWQDKPAGYDPTDAELERRISELKREEVRGLITTHAASGGEPLPSGPETEAAIDRILAGMKA